jgi:hypothetical protein
VLKPQATGKNMRLTAQQLNIYSQCHSPSCGAMRFLATPNDHTIRHMVSMPSAWPLVLLLYADGFRMCGPKRPEQVGLVLLPGWLIVRKRPQAGSSGCSTPPPPGGIHIRVETDAGGSLVGARADMGACLLTTCIAAGTPLESIAHEVPLMHRGRPPYSDHGGVTHSQPAPGHTLRFRWAPRQHCGREIHSNSRISGPGSQQQRCILSPCKAPRSSYYYKRRSGLPDTHTSLALTNLRQWIYHRRRYSHIHACKRNRQLATQHVCSKCGCVTVLTSQPPSCASNGTSTQWGAHTSSDTLCAHHAGCTCRLSSSHHTQTW